MLKNLGGAEKSHRNDFESEKGLAARDLELNLFNLSKIRPERLFDYLGIILNTDNPSLICGQRHNKIQWLDVKIQMPQTCVKQLSQLYSWSNKSYLRKSWPIRGTYVQTARMTNPSNRFPREMEASLSSGFRIVHLVLKRGLQLNQNLLFEMQEYKKDTSRWNSVASITWEARQD